ncbi:MAG TPA: cysteine desulfurase family protein [Chlamydiales bacterium]|nr:cysteine desulfurase family protein [Chlamydiales bacterium]
MIYLDNNSTTELDPRVFQAMYHEFHGAPSNPSSTHFLGQNAANALIRARSTIAAYLKKKPEEIIFTSGGTEAINLAIRGLLEGKKEGHILSSNVEHSAVYETLLTFKKKGFTLDLLHAGEEGSISPQKIKDKITPSTQLIALSWANNETGVKNDILGIAEIAKKTKVPLVVDAVAFMGKELLEIPDGVTALAAAAHKFHGPKGIGFLYLSSHASLTPLFTGGPQEYGKRAGTQNLEGIIGLGKAVELLNQELPEKSNHMEDLRDHFEKELMKNLTGVWVNGSGERTVNTSNLYFEEVDGEDLLLNLDLAKLAASHGSACLSGSLEPSRVLVGMGFPMARVKSSLRFSLSRNTTRDEIDKAVEIITETVKKLRKLG